MSVFVSNTDFADVSAFTSEVKKAFETATPPVVFSIDKREAIEPFAQQLKNDNGFLGKRVSCKHAKIGSFGNFSINELFSFSEERYPIQLSFRQLKECEDFANGWIRLIEKAEREKAAAEEAARKNEEAEKNKVEEERIRKTRLQENLAKLDDLKKELKTTEDRIAMIADKYLDGDLTKEEKQQLTERYSSQRDRLRTQINEIITISEAKKTELIEQKEIEKGPKDKGEQRNREPIQKKKSSKGKVLLWIIAIIIAVVVIPQVVYSIQYAIDQREYQERMEYERTHPSNYKKLLDALENGTVKYGMTYRQIADIVGEASSVSRSGGEIQFAYYYKMSSSSSYYDPASIQLCFRNGRLYNWND